MPVLLSLLFFSFFQAEDGIRDGHVTGVQTCALPIYDLFNTTINDINEHKGWTNTFILDEAEVNANRLQFRMYHDGYPIFSHEDYSMIEQRWEGQELYQYKRPLFKLTNLLSSEQVTLPSGKDVMSYLKENENR